MVLLYFPILKTRSSKSLLKFPMLIKKILKEKKFQTGPKCFDMKTDLLDRVALQVFEQKSQENGIRNTTNYDLVM